MHKHYQIPWVMVVTAMTLSLFLAICQTSVIAGEKPKLSIIWFAWPPCEALGELAARYPGAEVSVKCIPIAQWHDQIFTDFAAKGGADLPILDSQWIGEAVKGEHILELTDWMKKNMEVDDYVPAALSAYGEFPLGGGRYYGAAAMADTQLLVYRKDLFDKTGFKPAKTWSELLKQAQQFKKSGTVENGFVWYWCGSAACYDQIQVAWNQIAWSFGGELWDPKTYKVEGILNGSENIAALEFTRELYKTGPEGAGNFTYNEVVDAICTGKAAMTSIWAGFGPVFLDKKGCKESSSLGFAVPPGEKKHFLSLGGQGISVSAHTRNKEAALDFLKWFQSKETQLEWVKLGGDSARKSVLASDTFKNAAPYNSVFAEAYALAKDFWNLPEYSAMLVVQGEQLNLAVTGQKDSKTALETIAKEQQKILDKAYPGGPPKQ